MMLNLVLIILIIIVVIISTRPDQKYTLKEKLASQWTSIGTINDPLSKYPRNYHIFMDDNGKTNDKIYIKIPNNPPPLDVIELKYELTADSVVGYLPTINNQTGQVSSSKDYLTLKVLKDNLLELTQYDNNKEHKLQDSKNSMYVNFNDTVILMLRRWLFDKAINN